MNTTKDHHNNIVISYHSNLLSPAKDRQSHFVSFFSKFFPVHEGDEEEMLTLRLEV